MKNAVLLTVGLAVLAGCADPLARVEKLSDVKLAEDQPVRGALASADDVQAEGGLLRRLIPGRPAEATARADEAEVNTAPQATDTSGESTAILATHNGAEAVPERSATRGVAGWLVRRATGGSVPDDVTPDPAPDTELASLQGDVATDAAPSEPVTAQPQTDAQTDGPQRSGGFLGGLLAGDRTTRAQRHEIELPEVRYGETLPFGRVARACEARHKPMGREIAKAGRLGAYTLIDSAPESTGPRSFYVTGFADGCPRQFTAALAMFGAPSMHEKLRYGRPSKTYPYSGTDEAYEKVKSSVCKVKRSAPCGAKIEQLERDTVFITAYERFTDNGRWSDILLHDGAVVAAAFKAP
ncbi:hypothetical protein E4Z66_13520 [Aliishimia ponticola]|uniref:Uncharacterized protein n=1 Tax=Aliishimia ponticola TaxID=2499833 RepID=A0A4V3XK94_9RHOB|nr:hypothetical protein [Aliishimia ponticola]THH36073.1 hypothetical protein E4Z66_13520 [Aliishimia ponticola]